MKVVATLVGLMVLTTGLPAQANDAGILKCRSIADTARRLACYDAIEVARTPAQATGSAGTAAPIAPASAVSTPPRTAAASTAPATAEFGLPPRPTAQGVDRIESSIRGRLESWQQGSRIRLANGQLWQVTDDSRGICQCDNPKVVVTRGAFGTYFLEIEGKGNAPRVKRLE